MRQFLQHSSGPLSLEFRLGKHIVFTPLRIGKKSTASYHDKTFLTPFCMNCASLHGIASAEVRIHKRSEKRKVVKGQGDTDKNRLLISTYLPAFNFRFLENDSLYPPPPRRKTETQEIPLGFQVPNVLRLFIQQPSRLGIEGLSEIKHPYEGVPMVQKREKAFRASLIPFI